MKNFLFICLFTPLLTIAQPDNKSKEGKGIRFENVLSWDQAKERAKKENKFIFIDAYATWCVPCKYMDKQVFPQEEIGTFFNEHFISFRIQTDSTGRDDSFVRSWYNDAKYLQKTYQISAVPTFLFLNPDGILVNKSVGQIEKDELLRIADSSLSLNISEYQKQIDIYKGGERDPDFLKALAAKASRLGFTELASAIAKDYFKYSNKKTVPELDDIFFAADIAREADLSFNMAKVFKKKVMDSLNNGNLINNAYLKLVFYFPQLVELNDNIFRICYLNPEEVIRVSNNNIQPAVLVEDVIFRSIVDPLLSAVDPGSLSDAQWDTIEKILKTYYSKLNTRKVLTGYKIRLYGKIGDWVKWAIYNDQNIREIVKSKSLAPGDGFWALNLPAWELFLNSNNRKSLQRAVKWCDFAIENDKLTSSAQCLDTKANLLYKIGDVEEALKLEQKAIEITKESMNREGANVRFLNRLILQYEECLNSMKSGQPTYIKDGAIWNTDTSGKIKRGSPANK